MSLPEEPVLQTLNQLLQRQTLLASSPARNHGEGPAPRGNGPPVFIAPPPLLAPSHEDKALCMLMELALLSSGAAQLVAPRVPHDLIGESPVGQALNLVLAHVEEGDWQEGLNELRRRDDLLANPDVGRILLSHQHDQLDPEVAVEKDRPAVQQRLERAIADCVCHLRLTQLDSRIAENQQAQALAPDSDTARQLQREHFELVIEKQKLRQTFAR
jgi:hypothetical protein